MNEFWLWFWRPLAEFLGAITTVVVVAAVIFAVMVSAMFFYMVWLWLKEVWKLMTRREMP
jgi:hypothetical protein